MSLPHPPTITNTQQHAGFSRSRSTEAASQSSQSPPLRPYEATAGRGSDQDTQNALLACDAALLAVDHSPRLTGAGGGKIQRHFVAKQSYSTLEPQRRRDGCVTSVVEHTCYYSSSSDASNATPSSRLPRVDSLTGFFCTQRQSTSVSGGGNVRRPSSSGSPTASGIYSRRPSGQQKMLGTPASGGSRDRSPHRPPSAPNEDSPAHVVRGCFGLELLNESGCLELGGGRRDGSSSSSTSSSCGGMHHEVQEQQAAPRAMLVDAPMVATQLQRPHTSSGATYAERYRRSVESYSKQNANANSSTLPRRSSGGRLGTGPHTGILREVVADGACSAPARSHLAVQRRRGSHLRSKPAGVGSRRHSAPAVDDDDDDATSSVSSTSSSEGQ